MLTADSSQGTGVKFDSNASKIFYCNIRDYKAVTEYGVPLMDRQIGTRTTLTCFFPKEMFMLCPHSFMALICNCICSMFNIQVWLGHLLPLLTVISLYSSQLRKVTFSQAPEDSLI